MVPVLLLSPALYDQWRDQFRTNAPKAFEVTRLTDRHTSLLHEQARLKDRSRN